MTASEWERYAEEETLYNERALGLVKDKRTIISKIVNTLPMDVCEERIDVIVKRREERMRLALMSVESSILHTLQLIADKGMKM